MGSLSQDVLTLISLGGLRTGCPTPGWTTSRQAEGDKDLVLASTNQKDQLMSAKQAALLARPEGTSKVFRVMRYGHRLLLPHEGHQQSLITTNTCHPARQPHQEPECPPAPRALLWILLNQPGARCVAPDLWAPWVPSIPPARGLAQSDPISLALPASS